MITTIRPDSSIDLSGNSDISDVEGLRVIVSKVEEPGTLADVYTVSLGESGHNGFIEGGRLTTSVRLPNSECFLYTDKVSPGESEIFRIRRKQSVRGLDVSVFISGGRIIFSRDAYNSMFKKGEDYIWVDYSISRKKAVITICDIKRKTVINNDLVFFGLKLSPYKDKVMRTDGSSRIFKKILDISPDSDINSMKVTSFDGGSMFLEEVS